MADFRKWFLAFAVLALLSGLASAQITPAFTCATQGAGLVGAGGGVTPIVRAEGLTELVGDVVLTCTGGTSTAAGTAIPQANVTVFLSTNITSRILSTTGGVFTEALLLVDEPHSVTNPNMPFLVCGAAGSTEAPTGSGICTIAGTAGGSGPVGPYAGTTGHPNVFQGQRTADNQITFLGVPLDPPGTTAVRTLRITNIRANANQLGVSSTLIPTQITMFISINGSTIVPITNPQVVVAFVQPGMNPSIRGNASPFIQCSNLNRNLLVSGANPGQTGGFTVRIAEGFASSFKEKNYAEHLNNVITSNAPPATNYYSADYNQDVPGASYNSESGFESVPGQSEPVIGTTPAIPGVGIPIGASAFADNGHGVTGAGVANAGTRFLVTFGSVPNGVSVFVPGRVNLVNANATGTVTGYAVLVASDAVGGSTVFNPLGNGLVQLSIASNAGVAVYEVMKSEPSIPELTDIAVQPAFTSNTANNLPAPGVQSTITASFAPQSTVGTMSGSAPIPRFAPSTTPLNTFIINRCTCNILFPFVSNQLGFDTGIAISNTSQDPFGTGAQSGTITLNYYGAGTPPPAQTTNAVVPAGQTLAFTLFGGGNFGIQPTQNFQGYIIAQANFQYCHALAYMSAQGALPTSPGASMAYLGIILDATGLNRTGQFGEAQGH